MDSGDAVHALATPAVPALVCVLAIGAVDAAVIGQSSRPLLVWLLVFLAPLGLVARRHPGARAAVLFAATLCGCLQLRLPWPAPIALAVLVFSVATRIGPVRWTDGWWRPGRLDRRAVGFIALVVPVSAVSLVLWFLLSGGRSDRYTHLLQGRSPFVVVLLGLGFVLVNAVAEELAFNGIHQASLSQYLRGPWPVALSAAAFGVAHVHGFPSGAAGVALALSYGVLLAYLRLLTAGLLGPILAHVLADATIVAIVLVLG